MSPSTSLSATTLSLINQSVDQVAQVALVDQVAQVVKTPAQVAYKKTNVRKTKEESSNCK